MQQSTINAMNEAQALQAYIGAAEQHHPVVKFDTEERKAQLTAAQLVRIDKVVGKCLQHSAFAISPHLANPEVDPEVLGKTLAQALQTFLMIGPKDAYEIAPEAFRTACESAKDILKVDDTTIALCAFIKPGEAGAVTRSPAAARQWVSMEERNGFQVRTPVRINKGAYIVCKIA